MKLFYYLEASYEAGIFWSHHMKLSGDNAVLIFGELYYGAAISRECCFNIYSSI